jgi:hypothetical protein
MAESKTNISAHATTNTPAISTPAFCALTAARGTLSIGRNYTNHRKFLIPLEI